MSATHVTAPPDCAPVPRPALGPALNEQGYYVRCVEQNLLDHRRHLPVGVPH